VGSVLGSQASVTLLRVCACDNDPNKSERIPHKRAVNRTTAPGLFRIGFLLGVAILLLSYAFLDLLAASCGERGARDPIILEMCTCVVVKAILTSICGVRTRITFDLLL